MYCPEQLIFQIGRGWRRWGFLLWFQASQDTQWRYIPLRKWLNPLRYYYALQTPWGVFVINRDGYWHVAFANLIFRAQVRLGLRHSLEALQAQAEKSLRKGPIQ